MALAGFLVALAALGHAKAYAKAPGCTTDEDCSLNGVCNVSTGGAPGVCSCDVPWIGHRCQTLELAAGEVGLHGLPLCAYHGDGVNSTSWGGSVLHAPEDGKYYMWVASMVNNCTMAEWTTNSEVVLAESGSPLGPFERVKTIVEPWAHNPQAIRAPDNTSSSGFVYAVYTMGDGMNYHGAVKNCGSGPPPAPRPVGPPEIWFKDPCPKDAAHAQPLGGCMPDGACNFSIFYSDSGAAGEYKKHTAQIIGWPTHSKGRPWEYGPYGNWNPAPLVHPNGSVYLLAHTEQYGFKHGEAIIMADTWRGPYRLVASDSDSRWKGSTANAEDPFMWIDKRGNWHQLVEGNPMPGGHAWSADGIKWSNISGCNGEYALDGCFNLSRPFKAANGSILSVDYYTERPKLLLDAHGTPTVLYGTVYDTVGKAQRGFTIAEPLGSIAVLSDAEQRGGCTGRGCTTSVFNAHTNIGT